MRKAWLVFLSFFIYFARLVAIIGGSNSKDCRRYLFKKCLWSWFTLHLPVGDPVMLKAYVQLFNNSISPFFKSQRFEFKGISLCIQWCLKALFANWLCKILKIKSVAVYVANTLLFDANVSSFSLAESPPRDLQITAYK